LHIARIRARLQNPLLWPMLRAPSRLRHAVPRWAAGPADLAGAAVAAEVSRESVDGRRLVFYRPLDAARVVHEAAVGRGSSSSFVAVVAMRVPAASGRPKPGGAHPSPVFPEAAGALAHLRSLRKDHDEEEEERVGDFSDAESSPLSSSDAIGEGTASDRSLRLVPVVSDIAISGHAAAARFPHGFDIRVATSLVPSASSSSSSSSVSSENMRPIASTDSAVFAAADAIPAARWVGDAGDGCHRLAVYVFLRRNRDTKQRQAGRRTGPAAADGDSFLVRTVLLPPDSDGDDDDDDGGSSSRALKKSAAMSDAAGGGASCTVVIRQVPLPARASRETSRIITQDAAEPAYPVVWCNGQRLRVHHARPSKESLLFVATTAGEYLNACGECGGFGCDVFAPDHMDTAAGCSVSSGVVGYASDTDEVVLRNTSKDSNSSGGGHVAADAVDDGDSGVVTTARRVSNDAGGSGLLGAALRRRVGAGVSSNNTGNSSGSRSSSTSTGYLAASASAALATRDNTAANNNSNSPAILPSSSSPFHKPPSPPFVATSSLSFGKNPPAAYRRRRGPMAAGSAGGRLVAPIKRFAFAVFLPVRRLVIGRRVVVAVDPSSYISHNNSGSLAGLASPPPLPHTTATARKSVLALVVVLLVGCGCVVIGMRVSQLLVAAVVARRSPSLL
ncbi:hypothetical protein GGI11_007506, partial [Coemansia sp. RSA 2049]